MTTTEAQRLVHEDEDFVHLRRFEFSLEKVTARYDDAGGAPDHVIAAGLMITEDDVQVRYEEIVARLRMLMGA
jgi:hypothetical protein